MSIKGNWRPHGSEVVIHWSQRFLSIFQSFFPRSSEHESRKEKSRKTCETGVRLFQKKHYCRVLYHFTKNSWNLFWKPNWKEIWAKMFSRERYQIFYGVLELTPGAEIFVLSPSKTTAYCSQLSRKCHASRNVFSRGLWENCSNTREWRN